MRVKHIKNMYKLYRQLPNGKWKYYDTFNSTLDPNYHGAIEKLTELGIKWELRDSMGTVKFSR